MRKMLTAVAMTAALSVPAVSYAGDAADRYIDRDNNGVSDVDERMLAEMTMKAVEGGAPLNHLTVPGFVLQYADLDNDGKLNESEQQRARRRLNQSMSSN